MDAKSKISANGTYVLDPEDVEQLDELSLTSVMKEAAGALPRGEPSPTSDEGASTGEGDTTINEILRGAPTRDDELASGGSQDSVQSDNTEELLAPELIFPDLTPRRR